ncbi:hypothetical protein PR202_ga06631 [Eleusine coracana subsp. coracana]|uniref:FAS1 domain-containing protein n=1 Tax=Eleusine coracana subsp. coracana TaxID=191504 RepID=A0AAV5BVC9_ELECO|nr:hypothetical protein PR202_ga06631 [Eleusine coracana subsp. coracana]
MAPNEQLPFLLLALLLLVPPPAAGAFNITKILADFPEFDVLNALLLDTGLAHAINTREAVTLLAPNNTAFVALARGAPRGTTRSFIADLLALHVVLDYLDAPKLAAMQRGRRGDGSVLTTLLQSTRDVPRKAGFLRVGSSSNASASGGDRVTFSSAAPGGQRNATFERQVVAQPYNVSVLQVSGFVVPPGIKFVQPFPPPRARRHVAAPPPGQAPARAGAWAHAPASVWVRPADTVAGEAVPYTRPHGYSAAAAGGGDGSHSDTQRARRHGGEATVVTIGRRWTQSGQLVEWTCRGSWNHDLPAWEFVNKVPPWER